MVYILDDGVNLFTLILAQNIGSIGRVNFQKKIGHHGQIRLFGPKNASKKLGSPALKAFFVVLSKLVS